MTIYTDAWPGSYTPETLILADSKWTNGGPVTYVNVAWQVAPAGLLLGMASGSTAVYFNAGAGWTGSQWSEFTVNNAVSGAVQEGPAVGIANPGATPSYYFVHIKANTWQFRVVNAGAESGGTMPMLPQSFTPGANDVYALEVTAGTPNTLKLYINGAMQSYVATDGTITASASPPGIHQYYGAAGSGDIKNWRAGSGAYPGLAGATTITATSAATVLSGQTGVTITGTGFKAVQGTGAIIISPINDPLAAGAVTQTPTAWANTSLTFTAVRGTLSYGANYLFVKNSDGSVNSPGFAIGIYPTATIVDKAIDLNGAALVSQSGLTALVYKAIPATAVAPDKVFTAVTTDAAGLLSLDCTNLSLAAGTAVWCLLAKDGAPALTGVTKLVPASS